MLTPNRLRWPLLFSLLTSLLLAQEGGYGSFQYVSHLKQSTLLVRTYDDDTGYDAAMAAAIERYWTFTPYRFVSQPTLDSLVQSDPKRYSMLVRDNTERSRHGHGRSHLIRRNHLAIYPCLFGSNLIHYHGRLAITQFEVMDVDRVAAYLTLLPAFIQAMQHHVAYLDQQQVETQSDFEAAIDQDRQERLAHLAHMKLFLLAEQLPRKYQAQDWHEAYAYDLSIINQDALPHLLEEQAEGYAFLHVAPEAEAFRIIGLGHGRVYEQATPHTFKAFAPKDLKLLARRIARPDKSGGLLSRLLNW